MSDSESTILRRATILGGIILAVTFMPIAHAARGSYGNSPNQAILDRLAAIEDKLDAISAVNQDKLDAITDEIEDMKGAQVTATFCISQGRGLDIGTGWAAGVETTAGLGAGWPVAADASLQASAKFPLFIPIGSTGLAVPLPNEVALGVSGTHGRNMNICVDLPLEMVDDDEELLARLAYAINSKTFVSLGERTKFQRRAKRLLNYAKRRVPGVQLPGELPKPAEWRDEFDSLDNAIHSIFEDGFSNPGNGTLLGILKNDKIKDVVDSFGELPVSITNVVDNPDQLLKPFTKIAEGGLDSMSCGKFGIDQAARDENPGVDALCTHLEGLPDTQDVIHVLSGESFAGLYDALNTALDSLPIGGDGGGGNGDVNDAFCSTWLGSKRVFDDRCNR